jgi:transcriptional regulator with XRE-family HTH domain
VTIPLKPYTNTVCEAYAVVAYPMGTLGRNIRQLRRARDWTQEVLSARAAVPQSYISKYEQNKLVPEVHTLLKLAVGFGVSLDVLVVGENAAYDAKRSGQPSPEAFTVLPSSAQTSGEDQPDGRSARTARTVIDLRKQLKQQIANAEDHASELLRVVEGIGETAAQPGVLERFDVVVRAAPARRQHARKNRR